MQKRLPFSRILPPFLLGSSFYFYFRQGVSPPFSPDMLKPGLKNDMFCLSYYIRLEFAEEPATIKSTTAGDAPAEEKRQVRQ